MHFDGAGLQKTVVMVVGRGIFLVNSLVTLLLCDVPVHFDDAISHNAILMTSSNRFVEMIVTSFLIHVLVARSCAVPAVILQRLSLYEKIF